MDVTAIGEFLCRAGFTELRTNIAEITLYYRREGEVAYLSLLCTFSGVKRPDAAQLSHILQKIKCDERFAAQEQRVLALLCTEDMSYGRGLIQEGIPAWIIDAAQKRLMIYENQPEDFADIRRELEELLEGGGQTHRGGKNSSFQPVTMALAGINAGIFLAMALAGAAGSGEQMIRWGAMYTGVMDQPKEFYRVFTSMFLHFDAGHLAGNMIILLALGDNLERALGRVRYLLVYLLSGVGAGIASAVFNRWMGYTVVAAGASGAIFGVIGALLCLVVKNRGRLEELTAPRLGLMVIYVLYGGLRTPGVDNAAHLGGLLTGVLLMLLKKRNERDYED